MSGCDWCEKDALLGCSECGAQCCADHAVCAHDAPLSEVLCNPDRNTHPQGGCYRPPIGEVRHDL